jgi:NifU-like protein involved in Fe-S cluster formation
MHIYINIREGAIDDIRYMCMCDPTANVAVEILCTLIKGKTIEAARGITEESFSKALDSQGKEFLKKAGGIIKLLNRGLARYRNRAT